MGSRDATGPRAAAGASARSARGGMHAAGRAMLWFLSLGVACYAIVVYGALPLGAVVTPEMKSTYLAHRAGIYLHVFASSVALLIGPFQLSSRLRARHGALHRWLGRAYLGIGVLLGGLSGLYMSMFAFGGVAAKIGFALLALAWLYTGARALQAIWRGSVADHRKWMLRNFSLTFAAVTLRIYMPAALVGGLAFEVVYPLIAWLCWVPNLLVTEFFLGRKLSRPS